jgi:hypothetical protein
MKNNFTKILSLLLLLIAARSVSARISSPDSVSVIIACATSDEEKINTVKKLILSEPGVKYIDFCINHSVFLFTIQGTASDADAFADRIRKQSNSSQSTIYIKAYEFRDIRYACQSDNAPFGKPKR